MSRDFDSALQQYLRISHPILNNLGTLACWFNVRDTIQLHHLMTVVDQNGGAAGDFQALVARGDQVGDPVWAHTFASPWAPSKIAATTTGFSANTWHHGCAVFAADNDRRAYIDGGSKGTNNGFAIASGLEATSIGTLWRSDNPAAYTDGLIAEAGFWTVALTDAEVASLAAGACPLSIRPQNLVSYFPLFDPNDQDWLSGYDMAPINGPTMADGPAIFYPFPVPPGGGAEGEAPGPPPAPAYVNTSAQYCSLDLAVSWAAALGADGYIVEVQIDDLTTWQCVDAVGSGVLSITDTRESGHVYQYRVAAIHGDDLSAYTVGPEIYLLCQRW